MSDLFFKVELKLKFIVAKKSVSLYGYISLVFALTHFPEVTAPPSLVFSKGRLFVVTTDMSIL